MNLNKKLVRVFASVSALAITGSVAGTITAPTTVQAAYSSVNNFVNQNGFGNPGIEYRNSTFTQDFEFNNGAPEGIVVHETATPGATAENEATYFLREWGNMYSYVHAFVDANKIIQIHPTNRGVWGAGPMANGRFIQIELCEEATLYSFAKSVNNDAYYIAKLLHQYGLKPDLAEHDGNGTIWSHASVAKFLGGTDHSDPTGYFAKWGYSMDQFYDLIVQKYNELGGNAGGSVQAPEKPAGPDYSLMGKYSNGGSPMAQVLYNSSIAVWNKPGSGATSQSLKTLSSWKVISKTQVNGKWWYQLGKNQWIPGEYVYVTGFSSIKAYVEPKPEKPAGPDYSLMGKYSGNGNKHAQVLYNGSIAVWTAPGGKTTGQTLKTLSTWAVSGKAQYNGQWWYKLGKNQWIPGEYVYVTGFNSIPTVSTTVETPKPDKPTVDQPSVNKPAEGKVINLPKGTVATVNYVPGYGIAIWQQPGRNVIKGRVLAHGTRWKVFKETTYQGSTWFELGKNQWIPGQYLKF